MNVEHTRSPALVVVFSILSILAIALTAGLLLLQEREKPNTVPEALQPEIVEEPDTDEFDPIDWAREGAEYPPLEVEEDAESEIVSDHTVDRIQSEKVQPEKDFPEPVVTRQPTVVKPASKPVLTTPPKPQPKPPEKPKPAYREVRKNAYWVQIIATTNMSRAESVREELSLRGFSTQIMTQDTGTQFIYRVRLGAFDAKNEAESFAARIREIGGFEDSYVTLAPVTRRISSYQP